MSFNPPQPTPQTPVATAAPSAEGLSKTDIYSIILTIAFGIALSILASFSARHGWVIWLAVSVGGLGGLVHELAQSGGKILFFERKLDGIYIGSLAGTVLGAAAGLLAVRGLLINPPPDFHQNVTQLIYETFIAGMALKGLTEAAGGQALPQGSESVTPGQALALEASLNQIASGQPSVPSSSTIFANGFPPPDATLPAGV